MRNVYFVIRIRQNAMNEKFLLSLDVINELSCDVFCFVNVFVD